MSAAIAASPTGDQPEAPPAPTARSCRDQGPAVWPTTTLQRRSAIERMEAARQACLEDAYFLSLLGALLLEDGDSEQALLWLERALMLDPGNLGAQADFAIALAVGGEMGPLQALAAAWRNRPDIPAKLQARLATMLAPASRFVLPPIRLGGLTARASWAVQGEATLLVGHETNLDRSPRLNELTLTIPDGSIVLPVEGVTRRGLALLTGLSYKWAYAPNARWLWGSGVSMASRNAESHSSTDWQQYQWVGSLVHQREAWRAQLELSSVWVRGPLGEPFRQFRGGLGADLAIGSCRVRLGVETEARTQSDSSELDADYRGGSLGLQCLPSSAAWNWAMALRSGQDKPNDPDRPGGKQQIDGAGLQWSTSALGPVRLQASLRYTRSRDATGYSALLDSGAIRIMHLRQLTVEAAMPLPRPGLDLLAQWQSALQRSNLPLFSYRAHSAYMGLRYIW